MYIEDATHRDGLTTQARRVAVIPRRETVATILIGVFGLFLAPNLTFLGRGTAHKITAAAISCDSARIEASLPPTFKRGEKFSLNAVTSRSNDRENFSLNVEAGGGRFVLEGDPIPLKETIAVTSNQKYDQEDCLVLRQVATVKNPLYREGMADVEKTAGLVSTSYVTTKGKILYTETRITTKEGVSTSVSVSKANDPPDHHTLAYFYGPWMLALSKNFSWKCANDNLNSTEINVTGNEEINGHDCFVAKVTEMKSGNLSHITYWVDVKQRIAIQAKLGDLMLKMQ